MTNDTAEITPEPFADPVQPMFSTGSILSADQSLAEGMLVIGHDDAPLAMDVYLHPLSPYARDFQRSRVPTLIQRYVEHGTIAVRFITLPIVKYGGADDVVRATVCGGQQDKGYAVHEYLYGKGVATIDADAAQTIGLDAAAFADCVATMTGDILSATRDHATRDAVTLVPTYVIRGEKHVGLPTEADLLGAIEAAL